MAHSRATRPPRATYRVPVGSMPARPALLTLSPRFSFQLFSVSSAAAAALEFDPEHRTVRGSMMEMEINLPDEVPVMTLPNTAFFPQALMPLHIFEPRYQLMLRDVLATNRLFAVAGIDPQRANKAGESEPPFRVASLGIVRACQANENGTSDLLLQGLCRVEIVEIVDDGPYRRIRIRALTSEPGATAAENEDLRRQLTRLLNIKMKLAANGTAEMAAFLKSVHDPEAFVDIAAFSLCEDVAMKQRLLETLDVHDRLRLLGQQLRRDIEALKLRRKLQGPLTDDQIQLN